ncbi:MAG: transglutaminase domain-containing protein [Thermoguttaceae bacterium]|nr:transglutaminase domain-containing protein [Thermoguttaceae bacterium]
MNFAISSVLAVAAILASFMLQLGGEDASGAFVAAFSFFGILGALYFVDGKRLFAISKGLTNVLIVAVVLAHLGPLARSRQEFLAFSIANILAVVQTFLFYQKKTRRIHYQILTISFVEVAVGCVFQRSGLFAILTPIYALSVFCAVSLLTLEGERAYYAVNATLRPRFIGPRAPQQTTRDEEAALALSSASPSTFARLEAAALSESTRSAPDAPLRFYRRGGVKSSEIDATFFRRFVVSSPWAFATALVFFCLFPRIHRLEVGELQFGRENWNASAARIRSTVGFSEKIELGELGPSGDNRQRTLTVRFFDVLDPDRKRPVDPTSPIYLRGVPTALYSDRAWSQVEWASPRLDLQSLTDAIRQTSPTDPTDLLAPLQAELARIDRERQERERRERRFDDARNRSRFSPPPQAPIRPGVPRPDGSPGDTLADVASTPLYRPKGDWLPYFDQATALGGLKRPAFLYENLFLPTARQIDRLERFDDLRTILPPPGLADSDAVRRNVPGARLFDARARLLGLEIEMEALDSGVVFAPWPFYFLRQDFYFAGNVPRRSGRAAARPRKFCFATNAFFADGKQTELTPNQEVVWPYLDQYLALDAERFPELVATARRWDAESGLPKEDFAGRALYITSRLRDVGEYRYARNGVARTPGLDPLEDFVSVNKRGHCEYFAGALALMLRAVGIPSRTIVGFLVFPNEKGSETVVRQSDAHAWTEAFIPPQNLPDANSPAARLLDGAFDESPNNFPVDSSWTADGGWLRLDATPASSLEAETNSLLLNAALWSDFFASVWRDYVLDFNGARQAEAFYRPAFELAKSAFAAVRSFGENAFAPVASTFERLKDAVDRASSGDWSSETLGSLFASAARLALAAFIAWRLILFARRRFGLQRRSGTGLGGDGAARRRTRRQRREFAFYYRLERALSKRLATERRADETPLEFLERCFALEDEVAATARNAAPVAPSTLPADETPKSPRRVPKKTLNPFKKLKSVKASRSASAAPFEPTPDATRALFRELVERYYRARFAGSQPTAAEKTRWAAALRDAKIG